VTPNDIDVLLHYHVSPREHERIIAPAVRETIDMFKSNGILETRTGKQLTDHGSSYTLTPKGEKLVDMICKTPFPINEWRDPREA
jgi:hypothetical protein